MCYYSKNKKNRLTSSINTKRERKVVKSWSFGPIDKHKPDNPRVKKTQLEKECSNWNIVTFINILKRVMNFCHIASPFLLPYIFFCSIAASPMNIEKGYTSTRRGWKKAFSSCTTTFFPFQFFFCQSFANRPWRKGLKRVHKFKPYQFTLVIYNFYNNG